MLKGMTAEYLLHRTRPLRPGDTVLVTAAMGRRGLLLCQWAKALGSEDGTVSSEEKARLARSRGCDAPIKPRPFYRFATQARQISGGRGVPTDGDGLGRAAAAENPRRWPSPATRYGQASGPLGLGAGRDPLGQVDTMTRLVLLHLHGRARHAEPDRQPPGLRSPGHDFVVDRHRLRYLLAPWPRRIGALEARQTRPIIPLPWTQRIAPRAVPRYRSRP